MHGKLAETSILGRFNTNVIHSGMRTMRLIHELQWPWPLQILYLQQISCIVLTDNCKEKWSLNTLTGKTMARLLAGVRKYPLHFAPVQKISNLVIPWLGPGANPAQIFVAPL